MPESKWFLDKGFYGVSIQRFGYSVKFTIEALKDININIDLKGPYLEQDGNAIEKWVKFTSLKVNGQLAIQQDIEAWHDLPYRYILSAKENNAYQIEVKWHKK